MMSREIIALPIMGQEQPIDSRYRMVIIAAQRARQIMEGSRPLIQTRYIKGTTIALEEFLEGHLQYLTGKEARSAQREARRLREESLRSQALISREEEIAAEIKKDLSVYLEEASAATPPAPERSREGGG